MVQQPVEVAIVVKKKKDDLSNIILTDSYLKRIEQEIDEKIDEALLIK